MLQNLNGWHAVILLVIILLLFGAPKLPGLAKSLGQSMKIFKAEVKTPAADAEGSGEKKAIDGQETSSADTPATPTATSPNESATGSATGSASESATQEQASRSQTQHKP